MGGCRGGFHQKLPPCPTEIIPAGPKMDLPLVKVESISGGGSASWTTDFFKKGSYSWERDYGKAKHTVDIEVRAERVRGRTPGARVEISLQSWCNLW